MVRVLQRAKPAGRARCGSPGRRRSSTTSSTTCRRARRSRSAWWSLATFVLLFLLTGSVLVPVKALVLVVVSLGASLGVLVWGFQQGHLEGVMSFDSTGGIETADPGADRGARLRPVDGLRGVPARAHQGAAGRAGCRNDQAVAAGLQRSGRIITSAALVIVVVFLGFAAGELLVIKQTGIGLAVTVADRRDARPAAAGAGHDDPARRVELVGARPAAAAARAAGPAGGLSGARAPDRLGACTCGTLGGRAADVAGDRARSCGGALGRGTSPGPGPRRRAVRSRSSATAAPTAPA